MTQNKVGLLESILDKLFNFDIISETDCEAYRTGLPEEGRAYLKRYFVWNDNRGPEKKPHIYLHKFINSDPDRNLHDHPWNFISFILWRGYVEETPGGVKKRKYPGMILYRPANWAHRVHITKPAWTLVLTFKKKREWGFHTLKGWIHNQKFVHFRCTGEL
jgi:hypothetical protein